MNMMRANKHYFSCRLVSTPAQLFNCVVILLISIMAKSAVAQNEKEIRFFFTSFIGQDGREHVFVRKRYYDDSVYLELEGEHHLFIDYVNKHHTALINGAPWIGGSKSIGEYASPPHAQPSITQNDEGIRISHSDNERDVFRKMLLGIKKYCRLNCAKSDKYVLWIELESGEYSQWPGGG